MNNFLRDAVGMCAKLKYIKPTPLDATYKNNQFIDLKRCTGWIHCTFTNVEIQASKIIKNAMYSILRYLLNYAHKALWQY